MGRAEEASLEFRAKDSLNFSWIPALLCGCCLSSLPIALSHDGLHSYGSGENELIVRWWRSSGRYVNLDCTAAGCNMPRVHWATLKPVLALVSSFSLFRSVHTDFFQSPSCPSPHPSSISFQLPLLHLSFGPAFSSFHPSIPKDCSSKPPPIGLSSIIPFSSPFVHPSISGGWAS